MRRRIGSQQPRPIEVQRGGRGVGRRPPRPRDPARCGSPLADREQHARPLRHLVVDPLEEVVEELHLLGHAGRPVVVGPLLLSVHLEPFLRRRDLAEALERAARVQRVVGPARDDVGRDGDLSERCGLGLPVGVEERVGTPHRLHVLDACQRVADAPLPVRRERGVGNAAVEELLPVMSLQPSQGLIAHKCGGFNAATNHWM